MDGYISYFRITVPTTEHLSAYDLASTGGLPIGIEHRDLINMTTVNIIVLIAIK